MGNSHYHINKLTWAGVLITLGIIYGDIGTSPLYVMKAIVGEQKITTNLIYGAVSCVFWTLTLQTTIKYVLLTLKADNKGEGGIFSLFALTRRTSRYLIVITIVGGATLLADGVITPAISVSAAVEGLRDRVPNIPTVEITMVILSGLFLFQRFGTHAIGRYFGLIMFVWFTMLAVLGVGQIIHHPEVIQALSPHYAINLLVNTPGGFWILGAVFLCTTGAEALYSDLGHCGRKNIQISWIFVKICLVLNYLGQGAWFLDDLGQHGNPEINPFYEVMPGWFLYIGIAIATLAAIIASQALISGSFTLVSEAIRLNLFPKLQVNYPSKVKGQIYIPFVNMMLWLGCLFVVWYFKESSAMEAAYGLAITITMLATTIMMVHYLWLKRYSLIFRIVFVALYGLIEVSFLIANLEKFPHGGYITLFIAAGIAFVMWVFLKAWEIKTQLIDYVKVSDYLDQLKSLSTDKGETKFCTHLCYLSSSRSDNKVERNVLYSILQNQPKKADYYWFVHIEVTDEPYTVEYKITTHAVEDVIRVRFRLGFRVQQKVSMFMKDIVEDLVESGEITVNHPYHLINEEQKAGDFRFVILEEQVSYENELPLWKKFVLNTYTNIKRFTASPERWFGIDSGLVMTEKVPLVIMRKNRSKLKRIS